MNRCASLGILFLLTVIAIADEKITPSLTVHYGAINRAVISSGDASFAVYGSREDDKNVQQVLLTHHRRDVVTAARPSIDVGAEVVAPDAEKELIANPGEFWKGIVTARFHDYAQQSTKILAEPVKVSMWVKEGDTIEWQDLKLRVLDTPGYTRGAVSYVTNVDGKKIAFTGDLIYGDGKIFDLYSFQDAIPEANIRGYHGYGSRLAQLVPSLRKIAAEKPDVIIPARGPVIRNPQASIDKLIKRVQALYLNYQSTNALNWYFKEERLTDCAARIVDDVSKLNLMPYSYHEKAPDWVWENGTSRMLISDDGHGFLLDCGSQRYIDAIKKLMDANIIKQVDGIFVTHYHDDHTDMVQTAAEEFKCPVYATTEYADILEHPDRYHMPAMTSNPIKISSVKNGHKMKWKEFDLTMHFFPGQTYYHGAMLAKRENEKPIFFIGDAFSPSGMDDYCVLNRNLVGPNNGYKLCFKKMHAIKEDYWLVNEHIPFVFSFNKKELDGLESRFQKRIEMLRELFPWDDPSYGIDEQWAWFFPYAVKANPGDECDFQFQLTNHSPQSRSFRISPRSQAIVKSHAGSITLNANEVGKFKITVQAPRKPGQYLVTASVISKGIQVDDWAEALIIVE